MKYPKTPHLILLHFPARLQFVAPLFAIIMAAPLGAQEVRTPAADSAIVARYDTNRNGRLDPEELERMTVDERRAAAAIAASSPSAPLPAESVVAMSPFEVTEANTGYYASHTMSGTRLNTRLEDLASSISVVTKQQMADFAMTDINDIFNYESNTEGSGNYTALSINANGMASDQIQNNPQGVNRIRGMSPANIAVDNFATSGRVPIDPIDIDAVEISRGPNSSIFGLGSGSGTVNMVSASASFARARATAEMRFDDLGGWRASLDINRPIIPGKLAVRASSVYQHEAYRQKPSGYDTRRLNLMVRAQPFKYTLIRGSVQTVHAVGTRAIAITPRDGISWWRDIGAPTWDPVTLTATHNGVSTTFAPNRDPVGLTRKSLQNPNLFIDDGVKLWMIGRMPSPGALNGASNMNGAQRMLETTPEPVRNNSRPLYATVPGLNDPTIFNWEKISLAAPNTLKDQVKIMSASLEQTVLDTPVNKVAVQLAFQREDANRINRNIIGQLSATGSSYYLHVDPNERLLDGSPNPFFLRPYMAVGEPRYFENPYRRISYRGQAVYRFDPTESSRWTRWLGQHQLLGYMEQRRTEPYSFMFRNAMISDHPVNAPAGVPKGNQNRPASPFATRPYAQFYIGDNQGFNVDYPPSGYELGDYTFTWYDPQSQAWVHDPATLGRAATNDGSGGAAATLNVIKTRGAMIHSALLQNRIVVTAGLREDDNLNKRGNPSVLKANGYEFDYDAMGGWVDDWAMRSGKTKMFGVVVRPFRGWKALETRRQGGGFAGFAADLISRAQVHYNKSDSFRPATPAFTLFQKELPNPTSLQEEYGFTINLWDNKLILRGNWYENNQVNSRAGTGTLTTRVRRLDRVNDRFGFQRQVREWLEFENAGWTEEQFEAEVTRITGLSPEIRQRIDEDTIADTSDVLGQGQEYELYFNPSDHWTLKMNVTRQETLEANISPNLAAWIEQRMPFWTSAIDPRNGLPWFNNPYPGPSQVPANFLRAVVEAPYELARATEGTARPQTRKWRVNMTTSYRLAGMFDQKHLRRMAVGGALRWESKGAIGYFGIPVNGDITASRSFDPERPIYSSENLYADAFMSYTTRLYKDRIRARFQLNVKNLQESGRLQTVGAYPDGRAHTFRIINPRQFIFTTTFEL